MEKWSYGWLVYGFNQCMVIIFFFLVTNSPCPIIKRRRKTLETENWVSGSQTNISWKQPYFPQLIFVSGHKTPNWKSFLRLLPRARWILFFESLQLRRPITMDNMPYVPDIYSPWYSPLYQEILSLGQYFPTQSLGSRECIGWYGN